MRQYLRWLALWPMTSLLVACGGGGAGGADNSAYIASVSTFGAAAVPDLPLQLGPLETEQSHLASLSEGGIHVPAYNGYANTGAGVGIAMLDTSIQIGHPDLKDRVVAAHDFIDYDDDPSPPSGSSTRWHGTATSGVVAASANTVGVRGVAPLASLLAYRVIAGEAGESSGPLEDALTAAALARVHVINNSWTHQDNAVLTDVDTNWRAAMNARVGLTSGPVVVFAAGNGGSETLSNYDTYTNDYRVITVGAAGVRGEALSYSEPGANVLLVAPGSRIVTTDLVGAAGISATDYTAASDGFSGTSAAAPMVSGVVALMLQANPNLKPRDVAWILAKTAAPVDCRFCQDWLAPQPSAQGFPDFSLQYGFGRVDASAAVDLARTHSPVATTRQCDSGWKAPGSLPQYGLNLPDNSSTGVSSSYTVGACDLVIDRVEIQLKASPQTSNDLANYSGDLHVVLTSPTGLMSELARPHGCPADCGDIRDGFTFSSVRHMGERAQGVWTLKVSDEKRNDLSRFDAWRLIIHGH
jgi:subtilisin family serine protease